MSSNLDPCQKIPPAPASDQGGQRSLNYGENRVFILPVGQCFRAPDWCKKVRDGLAGDVRAGVYGYLSLKRWKRRIDATPGGDA
jgi:hypothetical protein